MTSSSSSFFSSSFFWLLNLSLFAPLLSAPMPLILLQPDPLVSAVLAPPLVSALPLSKY
ncbi:hypothetical protein N431DRAFT_143032 [Stipitochalara longipes BDJ]|nr:hypothetical protein N431DRAFT_143032 [Stipitochalara longipes BDJ]